MPRVPVRPRVLTPAACRRAAAELSAADPVMARIIDRAGPCALARANGAEPFESIVEAIVSQQLSIKAAATIYARVCALFGPGTRPSPALLLALDETLLRAAGLSRAKTLYVRDLAGKVLDGTLALESLDALDDEAVIAAMTQVKGIGRWSAEMYLMFRLRRPDVLPVGDLGIVRAVQRAYGLRKPPTPARLARLGEKWKPWRTVASWYLWQSLDATPNIG